MSRLYMEIPISGQDRDAQHSHLHDGNPEDSTIVCGCAEAMAALYGPAHI